MPVYEYLCPRCSQTTEALRKMSDADAPMPCEHCGETQTTRKQSVFSAGEARANVSLPMGGGGGGGGCACGNPHGPCAM